MRKEETDKPKKDRIAPPFARKQAKACSYTHQEGSFLIGSSSSIPLPRDTVLEQLRGGESSILGVVMAGTIGKAPALMATHPEVDALPACGPRRGTRAPVVLRFRASLGSGFAGRKVEIRGGGQMIAKEGARSQPVQMKLVSFTTKWWEKGLHSNMKDITSAQDLVDSLMNAGDKLVIVDFYSPGCGGCKALHPKICQFAELNPDVLFLQVNYEEHRSMCYSLNVHVLPFFRFYRGNQGRVCSFSCTNATIKKFKDALAKHTTERCSLGPARGLEESELLALAANKDLSFAYTGKSNELVLGPEELAGPNIAGVPSGKKYDQKAEDNAVVVAWR